MENDITAVAWAYAFMFLALAAGLAWLLRSLRRPARQRMPVRRGVRQSGTAERPARVPDDRC